MSLITLLLTFTLVIAVIFTSRLHAVILILCSICFFSLQHKLMLFDFDLPVARVVIMAGLIRIFLRSEISGIAIIKLDKAIILFTIVSFITFSLLYPTTNSIFLKIARIIDYTGTYFVCRTLIRNLDEIKAILKFQVFIICMLAITMIIENITFKNPLSSIFGAIDSSYIRDGRYRCKGMFLNSITAGIYGATSLPFVIGLLYTGRINLLYFLIGIGASLAIVYTGVSSGAIITFVFCLIGLLMWYFRSKINQICILSIVVLIALQLFMNAPIWYLFAKISTYIGGTGWHRAYLIDQAIAFFGDWWLIGTTYTAHWFPYVLSAHTNHADITNQFLQIGIDGGIISLILFAVIVIIAFRSLSHPLVQLNNKQAFVIWVLGVSLFGHLVSFFSVSYFDQIANIFYLLLAMIATVNEQIVPKPI